MLSGEQRQQAAQAINGFADEANDSFVVCRREVAFIVDTVLRGVQP